LHCVSAGHAEMRKHAERVSNHDSAAGGSALTLGRLRSLIPPSDFSTHFHSRNKPITPLPTPSNLSTSLHPIRIRPSRSNESVSKTDCY
jgi:hypothetical protein